MPITTIRLAAHPARRNVGRGLSLTVIAFSLGSDTPTRLLQAKCLNDITCAVATFGADLRAADPEASFVVMVSVTRGQRKPRGFDAADTANAFGQHGFLRSDVGEDALHRKLALPIAAAA